jgi:hypothetical protein
MIRTLFLVGLLGVVCGACSSSDDDKANCPDVGGDWHVTQHCDASLIDEHMTVIANGCSLTFGAPFNGFTGTVSADGDISVNGPQSCEGVASASDIELICTPNSCVVKLER